MSPTPAPVLSTRRGLGVFTGLIVVDRYIGCSVECLPYIATFAPSPGRLAGRGKTAIGGAEEG